jgi:DNA-binding CsgD family transcriptional regulator
MNTYATCLRGGRAQVLTVTGEWQEAEALGTQLLASCGPSSINRISPLLCLATIQTRRDQPGAVDLLDELSIATDGTDEAGYIVLSRLARAEAYWLQGNTELARREAELADDVSDACDGWLRGAIASWLRCLNSARTLGGNLAGPYVAEVTGDWRRAADEWLTLGCPYDAARALLEANEEDALREALALFEGLGALAATRVTRQRMRAIGVKSIPAGRRSSTRAHPLGLTRREREVLDLICAQHTNAEISAKLSISAKTVGHHVSAILAKLGVPTRAAARLSLVGSGK